MIGFCVFYLVIFCGASTFLMMATLLMMKCVHDEESLIFMYTYLYTYICTYIYIYIHMCIYISGSIPAEKTSTQINMDLSK